MNAKHPPSAALIDAAPALLDELQRAELIIQTMLGLMTTEQKARMAEALEAAHIAGEGATRHHERRAVIERATAR